MNKFSPIREFQPLATFLPLVLCALASMSAWSDIERSSYERLSLGQVLGEEIFLDLTKNHQLSRRNLKQLRTYIDKLDLDLDATNPASEISKINTAGQGQLSGDLHEIIAVCEDWREKTLNRVSCRNGKLRQYWQRHANSDEIPSRRDARQLARLAAKATVPVDANTNRITFSDDVLWDFSEFGAAFALDKASEWINTHTNLSTYRLSAADTVIARGYPSENSPWRVFLHPVFNQLGESYNLDDTNLIAGSQFIPWNVQPIEARNLNGAIDDSTGWPSAKQASFTLAETAFAAAVIAKLGSTETAQPVLEILNSTPNAEILMVAEDGRLQQSRAFALAFKDSEKQTISNIRYRIEFEIPVIEARPYHRPYLSIWISNENQKPLRNLLLLGDERRWMQELRVWWRRVGRRNQTVVDGLSSATRRPGQYKVIWDGMDDFGQPVTEQNLMIHVEASREDGGRSYQKIAIDMAQKNQHFDIPAKDELGNIAIKIEQPLARNY